MTAWHRVIAILGADPRGIAPRAVTATPAASGWTPAPSVAAYTGRDLWRLSSDGATVTMPDATRHAHLSGDILQ